LKSLAIFLILGGTVLILQRSHLSFFEAHPKPLAEYHELKSDVPFRGLDEVDLNFWTHAFFQKNAVTEIESVKDLSHRIESAWFTLPQGLTESTAIEKFAARLTPLAQNYSQPLAYDHLLTAFREAHEKIRLVKPIPLAAHALYLLDVLSDEVFYAKQMHFGGTAPFVWGHPRDLKKGDVLISKNTEFSSLLLQFRSPDAGAYSHAQLILNEGKNSNPEILESGTFGLNRVPFILGDYARLAVFRSVKSVHTQDLIAQALDSFLTASTLGGKADLKKAHPFDFTFTPDCTKPAYFCTDMIYCVYRQSGISPDQNPYPREIWQSSTETENEFIKSVVKLNWGAAPVPGDVELNPNFHATAYEVSAEKIKIIRNHLALTEAFFSLIQSEPELMNLYSETLGKLAKGKTVGELKESEVRDFAKAGLIDAEQLLPILKVLPPEMNLRTLAFYYHFERVLMPNAFKSLSNQTSSQIPLGLPETAFILRQSLQAQLVAFSNQF
jgi:hypothetical protein